MSGKVPARKIEAFISESKNCAPDVDPDQILIICCVSQEFGSAFCGMNAVV
jgi:hypothetical protein